MSERRLRWRIIDIILGVALFAALEGVMQAYVRFWAREGLASVSWAVITLFLFVGITVVFSIFIRSVAICAIAVSAFWCIELTIALTTAGANLQSLIPTGLIIVAVHVGLIAFLYWIKA